MKKRNTQHAQSKVRQKQIITAALDCFNEQGITNTSISDICRRAGASIGSIYHHFKGKEQLAATVYIAGIRNYQEGFLNALKNKKGAKSGIFAVINYHLNWVEKNPDWSIFLFQKRHAEFMDETEDEFKRLNQEFFVALSSWFNKHAEAGSIRKLPEGIYICILLGPSQEFSRHYITGNTSTPIKKAAKELSTAAWRALSE